jgi:hypothetical protein
VGDLMNKIFIIMFVCLLLLIPGAYAGIGLFDGSVELTALQTQTKCNLMVYSTIDGENLFHIEYSGDISKFVSNIEPNDFYLKKINCPSNDQERRDCITKLCQEGQDDYCRIICTTFKGPFELSLDPQPTRYNSGIRDVITANKATIVDALPFVVMYTPYDMKVVLGFAVVVIVIIAAIILVNRGRFKKKKR